MQDEKILSALQSIEYAIVRLPDDVSVEVTVDLKIHDDPPNLYVETPGGTGFCKVLGTKTGTVNKSITITFPEL